jgi:RNA polymerase sigma-70 factor (ECF subfamily)
MIANANHQPLTPEAFEALYAQYHRAVFGVVLARCRNVHVAEDIAQNTFLQFWQQYRHRKQHPNPGALLLRMARHRATDYIRRLAHRKETASAEAIDYAASREPSPFQAAERRDERRRVRRALAKLSGADRHLLTLRYDADLSRKEIAAVTKRSERTVKRNLGNGLGRLRQAYFA